MLSCLSLVNALLYKQRCPWSPSGATPMPQATLCEIVSVVHSTVFKCGAEYSGRKVIPMSGCIRMSQRLYSNFKAHWTLVGCCAQLTVVQRSVPYVCWDWCR